MCLAVLAAIFIIFPTTLKFKFDRSNYAGQMLPFCYGFVLFLILFLIFLLPRGRLSYLLYAFALLVDFGLENYNWEDKKMCNTCGCRSKKKKTTKKKAKKKKK